MRFPLYTDPPNGQLSESRLHPEAHPLPGKTLPVFRPNEKKKKIIRFSTTDPPPADLDALRLELRTSLRDTNSTNPLPPFYFIIPVFFYLTCHFSAETSISVVTSVHCMIPRVGGRRDSHEFSTKDFHMEGGLFEKMNEKPPPKIMTIEMPFDFLFYPKKFPSRKRSPGDEDSFLIVPNRPNLSACFPLPSLDATSMHVFLL